MHIESDSKSELQSELEKLRQENQELKQKAKHFDTFCKFGADVLWTSDLFLKWKWISPTVKKMRGITPEEALNEPPEKMLTPESHNFIMGKLMEFHEMVNSGLWNPDDFEQRYVLEQYHKDGSTLWTEVYATVSQNEDGSPNGMLGVTRDISERIDSERKYKFRLEFEQLLSSSSMKLIGLKAEEFSKKIPEILNDIADMINADHAGIYFLDDNSEFLECHYKNSPTQDTIFPDKISCNKISSIIKILEKNKPILIEKDGVENNVEHHDVLEHLDTDSLIATPIFQKGEPRGFIFFDKFDRTRFWTRDLFILLKYISQTISVSIDQANYEKILSNEKENLSATLNSIANGVIVSNSEGILTRINESAKKILNLEQNNIIGLKLKDIITLEFSNSEILKNKLHFEKLCMTSLNGRKLTISGSIAPIMNSKDLVIGNITVFSDISDNIKIEEMLLKKQKLESLGKMAGGIAHDFNNFLAAMSCGVECAKLSCPSGNINECGIEDVLLAIERANQLTDRLLSFTKDNVILKKPVCISRLINESAKMSLSGSNINWTLHQPDFEWLGEIDESQILQVFNNLMINSKHSMPDGGTIDIKIENTEINKTSKLKLESRDFLKITITDSGYGIHDDDFPRIFEPYYTTKTNGTGLGLTICFAIIQNHKGLIQIHKNKPIGTSVELFLPAIRESVEVSQDHKYKIVKGSGKLLLMDDESLLRKTTSAMLRKLGYSVETADCGEKALQLYKDALEMGGCFDLVIMDLTVPGGMGGRDCLEKIKEIDPNVKAIVTSAYFNDPIMNNYIDYGFLGMLRKPFRIMEISQLLYNMLSNNKNMTEFKSNN